MSAPDPSRVSTRDALVSAGVLFREEEQTCSDGEIRAMVARGLLPAGWTNPQPAAKPLPPDQAAYVARADQRRASARRGR